MEQNSPSARLEGRALIHNCNNLLTIIIGNIELASLRSGNNVKISKCLDEAQSATQQLADRIKTFSV